MLNLWWGMTEQTYLYYWHQKVWAVLVCWGIAILLLALAVLIGEELWRSGWRAGYQAATPLTGAVQQPTHVDRPVSTPKSTARSTIPEKRAFLAPPSQAFPGIRARFSSRRGGSSS
jgi:hypothetical protein